MDYFLYVLLIVILFETFFILYLIFNNTREIKKIKWSLYKLLDENEKIVDATDMEVI